MTINFESLCCLCFCSFNSIKDRWCAYYYMHKRNMYIYVFNGPVQKWEFVKNLAEQLIGFSSSNSIQLLNNNTDKIIICVEIKLLLVFSFLWVVWCGYLFISFITFIYLSKSMFLSLPLYSQIIPTFINKSHRILNSILLGSNFNS